MHRIAPWIPFEPTTSNGGILGSLPLNPGSVSFPIPSSVVPSGAGGVLVFAWARLSGVNPKIAYWHVGASVASGTQDWFSLLVASDPANQTFVCNSQAFWLPMPEDGRLTVTLLVPEPRPIKRPGEAEIQGYGEVEIHGYYPGPPAP